MLHPQAVAALELWRAAPPVHTLDAAGVEHARADARRQAAAEPTEEVAAIREVDADGVPGRLYLPAGGARAGCLVYAHGGGFVMGDVETHDAASRRLANRTGYPVLAVDYRCAPEHVFPAAVDDVTTAVDWAERHRAALGLGLGDRLVVLGDSAGANLVLVAALRRPGRLSAVVLVYPFLDPTTSSPSYAATDRGLDRVDADWFWRQYAGSADLTDPDLAPALSDRLGTLPPTLVIAAEHDTLIDEDVDLVRRIEGAGGTVRLWVHAGMVHGFWRHPALFDAAEKAMAKTVDFLRVTVPSEPGGWGRSKA